MLAHLITNQEFYIFGGKHTKKCVKMEKVVREQSMRIFCVLSKTIVLWFSATCQSQNGFFYSSTNFYLFSSISVIEFLLRFGLKRKILVAKIQISHDL